MSKKDKIKRDMNKWYESLKEDVDAKCSSDEVKRVIDGVKIQLEIAHAGIVVLEKLLEYAESKYKDAYQKELAMEEEDEKMMDELDAMHERARGS